MNPPTEASAAAMLPGDGAVNLTIDGRPLRAMPGSYVLAVAQGAGIEIPTLCHHDAVEPVGACRLCLVEVGHEDWGTWSNLVTACIYPVQEGLRVETRSARVAAARRGVLALLTARAPNAPGLAALAGRYGARSEGLVTDEGSDDCIVCGLCTRVCETYATSAITTFGRGSEKQVGGFDGAAPDECVGCGACASVCPTDNIASRRDGGAFQIWQRRFDTALAVVDATRCHGCGRCEEVCPFAVARVAPRAHGQLVATIPAEQCRGCGACLGACPAGAISQHEGFDWASLSERLGLPQDADEAAAGGAR